MLSSDYLKRRNFNALNDLLEILSFTFFSFFAVRPSKYDIVHSQGSYAGKMDVYTAHSCHIQSLVAAIAHRQELSGKLKKTFLNPLHLLLLALERFSLWRAEKVLAVSNAVKNDILRHYKIPDEKIEVVYNGVDTGKFNVVRASAYRVPLRRKHGLRADDKVILFPAHEFERKGLRWLLEAVNIMHDRKLFVLIAGDDDPAKYGPLIGRYSLQGNVIFAGRVTDIENYFAAADLIVLPSIYEPFGLVILEAMASGVPVMASRLAGASELITDRSNGLLIDDFTDYRAIARGIREVLGDPRLARAMTVNSRKTAQRYSWAHAARRISWIYKETAEEKKETAGPAAYNEALVSLNAGGEREMNA
jgi:UDP-glucose:(heptosyl)LPS alpha-1,3-glucosyltransferase